ncbi:MAG: heparinase II/III family protein [Paenibacillaceae bacterium]|nr:heparinase II/III family protein [Paenibacillaceae bacterium]
MKTRSTYYTADKVAAVRRNVERYEWAAEMKRQAVAKADVYVRRGLDFLWGLVPPPSLPRSIAVNQQAGSPVTGKAIDKYGTYPYTSNPLEDPWKLTDPSSGMRFPTNDFGAYYASGLDKHGLFQPELADRSLLVNILYPEKGADWGVDDGFGWYDASSGAWHTFIAYYIHFALWTTIANGAGAIEDALLSLRDAYAATGEPSYARAGLVLLDRIADVYPQLDISRFDASRYSNCHGGSYKGKAIGCIWETELVKPWLLAYDAFFPAVEDPVLVDFISGKATQHQLANPKDGARRIRDHIETNLVRQLYPAVKAAQIRGNMGFHQSALALAAVVMDNGEESGEWLDFVFRSGTYTGETITGGNMLAGLANDIDRDGFGNEAGPQYNYAWLQAFRMIADVLEGYDGYPAVFRYDHPKIRKMMLAFIPLVLAERYTPTIGDSGKTGNPERMLALSDMTKAFALYGEPLAAQAAYMLNGGTAQGLRSDWFAPEPERLAAEIEAVVRRDGPIVWGSDHLSGYGLAVLRDGKAMRDIWCYYGKNSGHGHQDALNIGLHAFGLDLAPDLGYPELANATNEHRFEWVRHTISHNTVLVDQSGQLPHHVGEPLHFDDGAHVKLIDVQAPQVYPQTRLYRRTVALIRIDEANSYALDWFWVKGGDDHRYSFHAAEGEVTTAGLNMREQPSGTYAGADVAFGQRTDGEGGFAYKGSGFHYLRHVSRDEAPASPFSVEWSIKDTWKVLPGESDIRLRLSMVGDVHEAALAEGVPPRNKAGNPEKLAYLIARRSGTDLQSLFGSVIEPYREARSIRSIERARLVCQAVPAAADDALAFKIVLENGRTDYAVCSCRADVDYVVDGKLQFRGYFGYYSEQDGRPVRASLHDADYLAVGGPDGVCRIGGKASLTGEVVRFTETFAIRNEIDIRLHEPFAAEKLVGRTLFVQNDGVRNAAYRIRDAAVPEDGVVRLGIGDATPIRGLLDAGDALRGLEYDIAAGAAVRIPLTTEAEFD